MSPNNLACRNEWQEGPTLDQDADPIHQDTPRVGLSRLSWARAAHDWISGSNTAADDTICTSNLRQHEAVVCSACVYMSPEGNYTAQTLSSSTCYSQLWCVTHGV